MLAGIGAVATLSSSCESLRCRLPLEARCRGRGPRRAVEDEVSGSGRRGGNGSDDRDGERVEGACATARTRASRRRLGPRWGGARVLVVARTGESPLGLLLSMSQLLAVSGTS